MERSGIDVRALQAELRTIVETEKDPARRFARLRALQARISPELLALDAAALQRRWRESPANSLERPVHVLDDGARNPSGARRDGATAPQAKAAGCEGRAHAEASLSDAELTSLTLSF